MVLLGRRQFALLVGRVEISGIRTNMQGDCKQRTDSTGQHSSSAMKISHLVRAFHCISFTIRLLTVLEQLNCEREENNAAWKNKNKIRAIITIKGRAMWGEKKIHVAERKERKKKVIYIQEYFPIEKKI